MVKHGDILRIETELVDVSNGAEIWGEKLDRRVLDASMAEEQTTSTIPANYASAYVGLADTYSTLPLYGRISPSVTMPKAKEALTKALEIDPDLSEAHASLAPVKNNAWDCLRQVMRPGRDQAFVLGFSHDVEVTQEYSDDPERLAAGVAALVSGGGTAFFDAIQNACDELNTGREGEPAARVLIVLSDGDDNASKTTLVQAIEKAQVRDVTIYTVNASISGRIESWQRPPPPGDLALKRRAEETGGRSFAELNKRDLKKAFSAIEQEMRNRYALSYQPGGLQEDGRFRPIKITARKSGRRLQVHSRKGYYARLASSVE